MQNSAFILTLADIEPATMQTLLGRYAVQLEIISSGDAIPGSFWGDSEAGLIDNRLLARSDTPLHSILHEACHYICKDVTHRTGLHTNAGGDYAEDAHAWLLNFAIIDTQGLPTWNLRR